MVRLCVPAWSLVICMRCKSTSAFLINPAGPICVNVYLHVLCTNRRLAGWLRWRWIPNRMRIQMCHIAIVCGHFYSAQITRDSGPHVYVVITVAVQSTSDFVCPSLPPTCCQPSNPMPTPFVVEQCASHAKVLRPECKTCCDRNSPLNDSTEGGTTRACVHTNAS